MQTTLSAKPHEVERRWLLVDAQDLVLGRAASQIASILRGKHKPIFTPHVDTGDFVVVVNAEKIRLTGNKLTDKKYHHHSGYIGGIKSIDARTQLERHPTRVLEAAVRRMLRRSPLGRQMMTKLKIYAGPNHPHAAQQPEKLELRYK
jgi:large subunit ribosomal protein L13